MSERDGRIEPGPACFRGGHVSFRFDGRAIDAYEGDTVGAALHAAGVRVLMRSIKYHRPRGLFCNAGKCASCLVRVDGVPNVRACVTPVRDGMVVKTQNAFPSARRDLFAVVDKVYRENFDYHARFIRPKVLTPIYHRVIREMAGFGSVPTLRPVTRPKMRRVQCDVAVVGAGPSGLSAAVAAAEGAASVVCIDEGDRAGGSLLLDRGGVQQADALAKRLSDAGGELMLRSVAFGCYQTDGHGEKLASPGLLAVLTPERVVEVRAKTLVVASGYHETPPLFPGNDLPGVMGARAGLVLLHRHGVLPGRRAVVTGDGPLVAHAARDLKEAGVHVVGVLGEDDWEGATIAEGHGATQLEAVTLRRGAETWRVEVDCVLAAGHETPRIELLQQAGAKMAWRGAYVPDATDGATSQTRVLCAGSVQGIAPLPARMAEGARVGERAAKEARA